MELTNEQHEIIRSTGNIKINAVAGSGKTTTIIEYAKARPPSSKILYLAFNKSVKLEAVKKFADKGLCHVKAETAHSLAYKHVVFQSHYKVRQQAYKTQEIVELLNLRGNGEKHAEYIVANHINKFMLYFCNSDKEKVQDLNYLDTITDPKAKSFVSSFYDYIVLQSRLLLSRMDKGEIEIIHDFYLKKFQLSNPKLPYDYILFDEGQDASQAMLDVFFKQQAVKVIVGDTHQQIYGWRFAVNSLEKADYKTHCLSTSFRFNQSIADLAMEVLKFKKHIGKPQTIPITGKGKDAEIKTKAVLARTNLGLLLKAIEYVTEKNKANRIYFEGNINSYTYADDGTSLYDVLSLYNEKHYLIKERHVANDEKEKATMIFSTVHRAKGMEYDAVQIVNDFISEDKLLKMKESSQANDLNFLKLNEEINLLYVAVTRTKNSLYIPENLMPKEFPKSPQIHVTEVSSEKKKEEKKATKRENKTEKAYSAVESRSGHEKAYKPWTAELDAELTALHGKGVSKKKMAEHFGRTKGAIISRIKKLELETP